jgi:mycothiol synthase
VNSMLPPGYYARPALMEDLPVLIDMFNAFSRMQIGVNLFSIERIRGEWTSEKMNLASNTMVVFHQTHQPAGYIEFWDYSGKHIKLTGWGSMSPEHLGCGIGSYLIDWLVQRARQDVPKSPPGARVVLQHFAESHNQDARALFARFDFADVRTYYWMRIDFDQPPLPPQLPEGITIRSISGREEGRAALLATYEAFQDHWGHVDEPFEENYRRRKHFMENDLGYDPALWFLALKGEQVVGAEICQSFLDGNPDQGWVSNLGVLRPWRKRGVGRALLQHAFHQFYQLGRKSAGLGVDAASLTGATRLYEKAGMQVVRRSTLYERMLRPGLDLSTQTID